ncbi:MAG: primosomal protein N', partial [Pseudomonadota bacterium]
MRFAPGALVAVLTTQPLDRCLDYKAPEGGVELGAFVEVPLGPRKVLGVVWGPGEGGYDLSKTRSILRRLDVPPMTPELRRFLTRAAEYTITPLTTMLRLATRVPDLGAPPGARKVYRRGEGEPGRMTPARQRVLDTMAEYGGVGLAPGELSSAAGVSGSVLKGLAETGALVLTAEPRDRPFALLDPALPGRDLSAQQAAAAKALRQEVSEARYGTTLLKGVTGSGKTEVYLEAVAECLRAGRQALVLLPEIALTGAFFARVEERFGAPPAAWHSGATQAERRRAWAAVATGQVPLVIGARSALFLPFRDLGLIVVDEEHDTSYKQEEGALYSARDMAVLRASLTGAAVVLATATPSLETWANVKAGKYARLDLPQRFGAAELPKLSAIDLRQDGPERGQWVSDPLYRAVEERVAQGEQALLFLNRRGYAPLTMCRTCGHQVGCLNCDARMVEHRFRQRLICHQCGAERPIPSSCPSCGKEDTMVALGPGVERLAE